MLASMEFQTRTTNWRILRLQFSISISSHKSAEWKTNIFTLNMMT